MATALGAGPEPEGALPRLRPVPVPGGGGGGGARGPRLASAKIAVVIVIAAETMLFTGLIGAFLVLRWGQSTWPPPGLPRLPAGVAAVNTAVLLASAVALGRSLASVRRDALREAVTALGLAAFLGSLFIAVQGVEWVRLVRFGLDLRSGAYGGTFFVLVGFHALHVAFAVGWLLVVLARARLGRYGPSRTMGIELLRLYWTFVTALWLVLYPLVYLL